MWEIRKGGMVYAHGPASTMPTLKERKQMRNAGYQVYLDGREYKL